MKLFDHAKIDQHKQDLVLKNIMHERARMVAAEIVDSVDGGGSSDGEDSVSSTIDRAVDQAVDALVGLDPEDLETAMYEVRGEGEIQTSKYPLARYAVGSVCVR